MTQTTNTTPYIALKPLKVGEFNLAAGDPVPVIQGRNYAAMCRKNMIRDVRDSGQPEVSLSIEMSEAAIRYAEGAAAALIRPPSPTAAPEATFHMHALAVPYLPGESVFYVSESGAYVAALFAGVMPADSDAAAALGVAEGEPVARIEWKDGSSEAATVRPADLLPEEPTARLIWELTAESEGQGEGEPADLEPVGVANLVIRAEEFAYLVNADGFPERVFIAGRTCTEATAEQAAAFGVEPGAILILVQFPNGGEENGPSMDYVPVSDLLPEQPTARLVTEFEGILKAEPVPPAVTLEEGGEEAEGETAEGFAALEAERDFLSLVLEAIRTKGEELPEGFPLRATLMNNGVRTLPGVLLLAEGDGGLDRLSALYNVSDKQAGKIISGLEALGLMRLPDSTEGQGAKREGEAAVSAGEV